MISFVDWNNELLLWQKQRTTQIIGKNSIFLAAIPSTNTYIKENSELTNGTIVIAYQQTQGKGTKNRTWISNPGGLYLSINLQLPFLKDFSPFWITAVVSVAFCDTLEQLGYKPIIKWPNDILINSKKVAGILTETIITNKTIISIVGIGCNVNNSLEQIFTSFPDLKTRITSLLFESQLQKPVSIKKILDLLLPLIEKNLFLQNELNISDIKLNWLKYSKIEGKKVEIKVLDSDQIINGIVTKVTDFGTLLIENNEGITEEITSGDVKLL